MTNENLQTYYVIWRGDEDDFMITQLDLDPLMMAPGDNRLSNDQIIEMCWDAEYAGMEGQIENPHYSDGPTSYDLIDIITGTDVKFVGAT